MAQAAISPTEELNAPKNELKITLAIVVATDTFKPNLVKYFLTSAVIIFFQFNNL